MFRYVGLAFLLKKASDAQVRAVTDCAEDFVGKVQNGPEMPVDTGTLRGGVHVESIVQSGRTVTATIATGGEADEYAIPQHEGTSRGVPATKFMEAPLIREAPVYEQFLKRAVDEAF